ncbi:MAG: triose-phosphate isomerase [Neisseriaceae bacterium]|nr:triose-phosphate isomerase [Neisseriaceae bacterium]
MWQKKWILCNWKMNGSIAKNFQLLSAVKQTQPTATYIGIASPYPYLLQTSEILRDTQIASGTQDCSRFKTAGAYSGEVSAQMIADCGGTFTLIGHSERRNYFSENNETLRCKLENALNASIIPVLCVGETLNERENNQAENVISSQLEILKGLNISQIAIAYEPVWAIGTGVTASTSQIETIHKFIYNEVLSMLCKDANIRLLYGGSVSAKNVQEILTTQYVDGALVGGASLKADEITDMIVSIEKL